MRISVVLFCLFVVMAISVKAQANDRELQFVDFEKFQMGLKLSGEYRMTEIDARNGFLSKTSSMVLREGLSARTEGSILHDRFLSFFLDAAFQIEQDIITRDSQRDNGNGIWYEGKASVNIFKKHPYSMRFFWDRTQFDYDTPFSRAYTADLENYGGDLWWKNSLAPMHFYANSAIYNSDRRSDDQDTKTVGVEGSLAQGVGSSEYDVNYKDVKRLNSDYTELKANFREQLPLSDNLDSTTLGRYGKREGLVNESHVEGTQKFLYTLDEDLNLFSNLQGGKNKFNNTTLYYARTTTGYRWQLYDNFQSNGRLFGYYGDTDDNLFYQFGPEWDLSYYRNTNIGRLGLNYSVKLYQEISDPAGQVSRVIDEQHTYNFGVAIELERKNIDAATIVVTNELGSIIYLEGVDYTITTLNGATLLDIPIGSTILPASAVKVSYNYIEEGYKAKRLQQQLGLSWQINKFTFIYEYSDLSYFDFSGDKQLWEFTRHRFILQYLDSYLDSKAQYEMVRRDPIPYDQILLHQGLSYTSIHFAGKIFAEYYITDYKNTQEKRKGFNLGASLTIPVTEGFTIKAVANYVNERAGTLKEIGYAGSVIVDYRYRAWTVQGKCRLLYEDIDNRTKSDYQFRVEIERSF